MATLCVYRNAGLPVISDHLRRRLGQFDLCVHFVDLRVLRFQSFAHYRECSFQSLHLLMLFVKLVQQGPMASRVTGKTQN